MEYIFLLINKVNWEIFAMNKEIEELRKQQKEELELLKAKQKEKLAHLRTKEKKRLSRENTTKRKSLARLDIIMGALVRKTVPQSIYIQFIKEVADERDCSFASERYQEWLYDDNKSNNSYQLIKKTHEQPELSGFSNKPTQGGGFTSQQ